MLRRAARERREFIYKKAIEQRQKTIEEKRERVKNALDGNLNSRHKLMFQILNLNLAILY